MAIDPADARRRRQAGQGPAPLPPRRSHVPRQHRRGDRRNDHRRHGRAAPGHLRRAHPPRVRASRSRSARRRSATAKRRRKTAEFNFKHKKQTGGSGQYAHIVGRLELLPEDATENVRVRGERRRRAHSQGIHSGGRKGLPRVACTRARSPGSRSWASRRSLEDGSYHEVDSSDMAFQICARNCFRETFLKTKPVLLEPVMKIEIEVPAQYPGPGGRRPDQPPRHDRVDRGARATLPRSKAKCRWPRPSATRPTCAA